MANDFKREWMPWCYQREREAKQLLLQAEMIIETTSQIYRETSTQVKCKSIWLRYAAYLEAARQLSDRRRRMVPQLRTMSNGVIEPVMDDA